MCISTCGYSHTLSLVEGKVMVFLQAWQACSSDLSSVRWNALCPLSDRDRYDNALIDRTPSL